jgi:hypothetical protein
VDVLAVFLLFFIQELQIGLDVIGVGGVGVVEQLLQGLDGEEQGFDGVEMLHGGFVVRYKVDWAEGGAEEETVGAGEELRGDHLVEVAEICHQLISRLLSSNLS